MLPVSAGFGLPEQIRVGDFAPLLHWLQQHIHASGRTLKSDAIVEKVSGKSVSEKYLVESLYRRYGPLHGLSADPVELI